MAQRGSGYERKANDEYYTPAWVTEALLPHVPSRIAAVWEPAAGKGGIADVLNRTKLAVRSSDLNQGYDFLGSDLDVEAIITNPPYKQSIEFIRHALERTRRHRGFVAMLLSTDFDHGKTREWYFGGCPIFSKKLVLTKRIVWFEPMIASPSSNHAWFMWDWQYDADPTIAYYYEETDHANRTRILGNHADLVSVRAADALRGRGNRSLGGGG